MSNWKTGSRCTADYCSTLFVPAARAAKVALQYFEVTQEVGTVAIRVIGPGASR